MNTQPTITGPPLNAETFLHFYQALPADEQKKAWDAIRGLYQKQGSRKRKAAVVGEVVSAHAAADVIHNWPFPEDRVWHLQALVGEGTVDRAITTNEERLTGELVIDLLTKYPLSLYTDDQEKVLFFGHNKLAERDLGPLKPIDTIVAVRQYGLAKLEEASERSYARI